MKTETIVHAHIVTTKSYADLVERIESDFWSGAHVKTSWELFAQIDGKMLGAEYRDLTREQAISKFKDVKDAMMAEFNAMVAFL